jgi:hypothetical protein
MSIDFRSYTIHSGRPLTDAKPTAWGPTISSETDGDGTTGGVGLFWKLTHIDGGITTVVGKMTKYGIMTLGNIPTVSLPTAAAAGAGAIVYDSTINKLKFSNGTSWETVTSS